MGMDNIPAKALLEFSNPSYDSKIEETWASIGKIYIEDYFKTEIIRQDYSLITFNLPGKIKYTPDFSYVLADGHIVICEVKNSRRNKGYRTTINKLKTIQSLFPFFVYIETIAELGWEIKAIGDPK